MTSCVKVLSIVLTSSFFPTWAFAGQGAGHTDVNTSQAAPQTERSTMSQSELDITSQFPGDWRITLIGTEEIPANLGITLKLDLGKAQFFTGCNTVDATHLFASGNFRFSVTGTTEETCSSEVMAREAALVEAIAKVDLLSVVSGSALGFYDLNNQLILAATRARP